MGSSLASLAGVDCEAPGPSRLKDPELAWAPFNEAVLRRGTGLWAIRGAGRAAQEDQLEQVQDFCKKGAKVEVLAPSNRWREAQVVRVGGGVARIHYTGYDAQFDEEAGRSGLEPSAFRPFGQIRSEKLKERKDNFVLQMDAGCCPGCGVKLQCTDKMALGYVPPDKFVKPEEEDLTKPLAAEDEVALSSQRFFKVIANVYLDIRNAPDVNAERTPESLVFGRSH
eukprot:Skav226352  [mRNA]  locus=scaffold2980:303886:308881:- [translate_table: standard]